MLQLGDPNIMLDQGLQAYQFQKVLRVRISMASSTALKKHIIYPITIKLTQNGRMPPKKMLYDKPFHILSLLICFPTYILAALPGNSTATHFCSLELQNVQVRCLGASPYWHTVPSRNTSQQI